jgi:hypothetical protein
VFVWIVGFIAAFLLMFYRPFRDWFTPDDRHRRFEMTPEINIGLEKNQNSGLDEILEHELVKKKYDHELKNFELNHSLSLGSKNKYFSSGYKYYWIILFSSILLIYIFLYFVTNFILGMNPVVPNELDSYMVEISKTEGGFHYILLPCISLLLPFSFINIILKKTIPYLYLRDLITRKNIHELAEDIGMDSIAFRVIIISLCMFFYFLYLSFSFQQNFYFNDRIIQKRITWQKTYPLDRFYSFKRLEDGDFKVSFMNLGYINILAPSSEYNNTHYNYEMNSVEFRNKYLKSLSKIIPEIKKHKQYDKEKNKPEFNQDAQDPLDKIFVYFLFNFLSFCFGLFLFSKAFQSFIWIKNKIN